MKTSVIITTYNSAQTIEIVINYTLANITDNDEIVIVDDGSNDDTVKKIKNINNNKINLICSNRVGRAKALNIAVKNSKGKYLFINDADDLSSKTRFIESMKLFEDGYDGMFGQTIIFKEFNENISENIHNKFNQKNFNTDKKLRNLNKHDLFKTSNLHHSSFAILKKKLLDVGSYNEDLDICIDLDLYYRLLVNNLKICVSNDIFTARYYGQSRFYAKYPPKKYLKNLLSLRNKYRKILKPSFYTYIYDIRIFIKNFLFR